MDLNLLERFVSIITPPKGKQAVNVAFNTLRLDPAAATSTVGMMIARCQMGFADASEVRQQETLTYLITGIMIAWATENEIPRKNLIDGFLKQHDLVMGKNVVDFFEKKAGR